MFYYPPTADPGCDGVRVAGAELPLWFKVRPVMKLTWVVVLQKWSFMCSLPVAVACGVRHQVLVNPKPGFNPESELPFVVRFQLPLTLNSRANFTLSKFCPLKLCLCMWFYLLPHQHDKGCCPGASWRGL